MAQLVKNPPAGDIDSIPELGRSPGEGKGYPLQYSGLEDPDPSRLYSPWGRKGSADRTEPLALSLALSLSGRWKKRREETRAAEDEMVRWHHRLNGHEPGQTPGDGEGQGGLACCSPWGCRVRHN